MYFITRSRPHFSCLKPIKHSVFLWIFCLFCTTQGLFAQLQANFTPDKNGGCSPLTISFTDATRGASSTAIYSWDLGNGNTSTLKNPGAIYNEEKTYTIKLTVTDGDNSSVKTLPITVYKKPTADFGPAAPKVCLPAPAVFVSSSTPGDGVISSYHWDYGNGVTQQSSSSQISYNFNSVQKATVNLTVTNSYGCAATVTKQDVVEVLPQMIPSFSYDKSLFCEITDVINFNANASTGPGTLQYKWQFGDGNGDVIKNPSYVYNKKGLYTASLTISNEHGCQASTSRGTINVAYFNTAFNVGMLCRQVNFSGSSYLSPSSSRWYLGDNTESSSWSSLTRTYASAGTYTVKLVNTYGVCKDSVSQVIDVKDYVNYNTTINVPGTACVGQIISLSSSSSVSPTARLWSFGDGSTNTFTANPTHSYSQPGTYTVKLLNTFGTCKEEVTKDIVVNALPVVQPFDVKYGGLCGAPVTLTYKDNTPGAVAWNWRINYLYVGGQTGYSYVPSTIQDPSHNYTSDGSYYVDVVVSNAAGCTASTGKYVTVTRPSVGINTVKTEYPGGVNNCDDVKMKFKFTSSEVVTSFKWDFGDGNTSADLEPEFTFTKTGRSPVSLSYTTINGCTGTVGASSAMVYRKPETDFSYAPAPCAEKVLVNFNSSSYPNTHFAWDIGNGYMQTSSSSPGFNFPDTGYYLIKHIGFNGGCSDTMIKTIYTGILPKFINITSVSPQTCIDTRGTITFNQSSLRATGLLWNFGDGNTIPYDTANHNVKHTYTQTGRYSISLTASSDGCPLQQNSNVTILLKQKPVLAINTASICSNQSVTASISGMETNPYTSNSSWDQEYYQYSILKFEYEDGSVFSGNSTSTFSYNSYSGNLSGLKVGDVRIRAIIRNNYIGCYDTSNYVSIKVNGPKADLKVSTNDVCWKSPLVFQDLSTTPTNTPIVSWRWTYGDGGSDTKSDGSQVSHTYTSPGSFSATLAVTDAIGCTSSKSATAIVRGPKVAFTPTATYPLPNVPLNTTVTFNNNTNVANSPGVKYEWDYGNGVKGTQNTGVQTYPTAGDYTIKLIATDPVTGCTDNASTFITVRDFNTAFRLNTVYLGASGTCLPVQLRITNLSSNVTSYSWDFGDGTRLEGPSSPSHTYTTPGKKVIILYSKGYNNLTGLFKDSIYIEETSATMQADVLKGCTGQQVNLSAQATNTSSYLWDFGDGTLKQTTADPFYKHTYLSPGVFTPKVIVKDARGCGNTASIADKVIIDSLRVSISSISDHLCQYTDNIFTPDIYSLAESFGETLTYKWDYGTGNSGDNSFLRKGAFRYENHGPVTIRLTVTSPYGCTREDSRKVDVHEKFGLQIYAPSKLDVCKNSKVQIVASGAYSYEWINHTDDLSSTEIANPFASPVTDTTYTVVGYDRWKCSSDTTQTKVTVRPLPTVVASPDAEVVANTDHQLFATGSPDVVHYVWSPATYLSCNNCTSPVVRPKKSTSYVVKVRTGYNCVSSDTVNVKLLCLNGFIYIPNSFTPNLDGKNELFYIKGKGIGIIKSFRIFNRWGDMVFERKNFEIDDPSQGWNGRKNGNPVPTGTYVYMAEMQCENGGDVIVKKGTVTVLY